MIKTPLVIHPDPNATGDFEYVVLRDIEYKLVARVKRSDAEHIVAAFQLAERVARLNRDAGEIGAGMLAQLVDDARAIVGKPR